MAKKILETKDVAISFGGLKAVQDFNFTLSEGELVGLIGPNGAGKTTIFNMLTGVYTPTEGEIIINGEVVNGKRPDELVDYGVARTFQNIRLFNYLSVIDNVKVAANKDMNYSVFTGMLRMPEFWKEERQVTIKSMEILDTFGLEQYKFLPAGALPYGAQRKLEIARAIATGASILLLDEPAAGMNPAETEELMKTIELVRDKYEVTILLIEHDMNLVLGICKRLVVLNYGEIIAEGDPHKVIDDPAVITAYLGRSTEEAGV